MHASVHVANSTQRHSRHQPMGQACAATLTNEMAGHANTPFHSAATDLALLWPVQCCQHFAASTTVHTLDATEYFFFFFLTQHKNASPLTLVARFSHCHIVRYHSTIDCTFIHIRPTGKDCASQYYCPATFYKCSPWWRYTSSHTCLQSIQNWGPRWQAGQVDTYSFFEKISPQKTKTRWRSCVCLPSCRRFMRADFIQSWGVRVHAADMIQICCFKRQLGYPSELPQRFWPGQQPVTIPTTQVNVIIFNSFVLWSFPELL